MSLDWTSVALEEACIGGLCAQSWSESIATHFCASQGTEILRLARERSRIAQFDRTGRDPSGQWSNPLGASTLQSAQPISRKSEGKMQSTPASLEELKEQERSLTLAKTGGKIYGADGGTALLWTPANGAFLASSADGLKERLTHQQ